MTGYGSGFALLPLRVSAHRGDLATWDDAELSLLIALAAHTNEDGTAYPSQGRLAKLAGTSKSTVDSAIAGLARRGWVTMTCGMRGRLYRLRLGDGADSVAIRQAIVFSGLWATCTPAARKLLILLLAYSRPGDGCEGAHISDWDAAIRDGNGEDGTRHVLPHHMQPANLARLIGVADRTYRDAMDRLLRLGLIEQDGDSDNLLIPNVPGTCVLEMETSRNGPGEPKSSPAARRAATWRRKKRLTTGGICTSSGIEGDSP